MLVRASLIGSSVFGLNVWQANKVHAAEPSTSEQTTKKKIRPSEVSQLALQVFAVICPNVCLIVIVCEVDYTYLVLRQ